MREIEMTEAEAAQIRASMAAADMAARGLTDLAELQHTQPAIHQALMNYADAIRTGDQVAIFKNAADIAAQVLALAAGEKR